MLLSTCTNYTKPIPGYLALPLLRFLALRQRSTKSHLRVMIWNIDCSTSFATLQFISFATRYKPNTALSPYCSHTYLAALPTTAASTVLVPVSCESPAAPQIGLQIIDCLTDAERGDVSIHSKHPVLPSHNACTQLRFSHLVGTRQQTVIAPQTASPLSPPAQLTRSTHEHERPETRKLTRSTSIL